MSEKNKITLSTCVGPTLAAAVKQEAKEMAVSTSAVLRWALMERYQRQVQDAGPIVTGLVEGAGV